MSDTAQEALRNNNRVSALAALRSKKLNETTLTERSEALARLEEVYSKIEQATDQSAIVRVMEASTAVLRSLYVDMGGVNKVEGVIEDLREEMSKVDEVSSALEAGGQGDDVVDESAVNEEFEELERQSILEEEKARVLYTQKRLATIDDFDAANEARESQQATTTKPQDVAIEEGTKALNRLSLERQATPDIENGKSSQALAE